MSCTTPKTKEFVAVLNKLNITNEKTLVIVKEYTENVILAARNLQNIVLATATEVGVLDLMSAKKVVVENAALEIMKEVLK